MKSYICKNAVFKLIPKDLTGATIGKVVQILPDSFVLELATDEKYLAHEHVELFTMTPQGLLYFESFISEIDNNKIKLLYPISHKFLQRREYTRIDVAKKSLLRQGLKEIEMQLLDISAGGMKISCTEQLDFASDYEINIEVEKNVLINCLFQPIRIEVDDQLGYTVSGRFKLLKNLDRISLVQFCFKKQMENQNK